MRALLKVASFYSKSEKFERKSKPHVKHDGQEKKVAVFGWRGNYFLEKYFRFGAPLDSKCSTRMTSFGNQTRIG